MSKIVGIDPGITGGIALLDNGELDAVEDMPVFDGRADGGAIADHFLAWEPTMVVIENTQPMPKNGSIASFSLGLNTGIVIGVVQAMGIPLHRVRPVTWKRAMHLHGKNKSASRGLANELYPAWRESFRLVKHDGRAEAVLIARWMLGEQIHAANASA